MRGELLENLTPWKNQHLLFRTETPLPHHLGAIWRFGDDFRGHPIRCSHQRLPLWDVLADLSAESKIRELDLQRIKGRLSYQDRPGAKEEKGEAETEAIVPFHL